MSDFFWEALWRTAVAVITGIVGAIVAFAVTKGLEYRYQRWLSEKLRKQAEQYLKKHGQKEAALLVSVLHEIEESARAYLEKTGRKDIPLLAVHQAEGFSGKEEQWQAHLEKVKAMIRRARAEGFVRLYVFTNVPVAEALLIGATLANGPEAVIHHFVNGVYLPVGRMSVETIRL